MDIHHTFPFAVRRRHFGWLTALLVASSHALVLEDIRVRSYLGQPFRAQIQFHSEADDIVEPRCVKLIPLDVGGGTLPIANSQIQITDRPGGGIIRIHTRQAINEPVLQFAVQLDCGSGQLTREYTILIDPEEMAPSIEPAESPAMAVAPRGPSGDRVVSNVQTELPPQGRPSRTTPRRKPTATPSAAKPNDQPQLHISPTTFLNNFKPDGSDIDFGIQLQFSKELGTTRPGARENNTSRDLARAMQSDDQTAAILQLEHQIGQLEKQLAALRAQMQTMPSTPPAAGPATPLQTEPSTATTSTMPSRSPAWLNYLFWALLGGVILGLVAWLYRYRSRHMTEEETSVVLETSSAGDEKPAMSDIAQRAAQKAALADGLDFDSAKEDAIIVNDHERWLIEEAQIFLKQGWRDQAINLLDEEVTRNPYQLDIWLMLFEIFQKDKDKSGFAAHAERFKALVRGLPIWRTIREMGATIDPENPLYQNDN
ncbi:hypothetical protein [Chitinivorax sp. B]|uniref:type IV pilus assembly protein FimV n=1 Tax=Chitinivorax sp. B TaxID=2502235 RepID=UPI0010F8A393|nr:hypothetical protein [Chitinivorax sp. B]